MIVTKLYLNDPSLIAIEQGELWLPLKGGHHHAHLKKHVKRLFSHRWAMYIHLSISMSKLPKIRKGISLNNWDKAYVIRTFPMPHTQWDISRKKKSFPATDYLSVSPISSAKCHNPFLSPWLVIPLAWKAVGGYCDSKCLLCVCVCMCMFQFG